MLALLKPWLGTGIGIIRDPDDLAYSLAHFISRIADSLALASDEDNKLYYRLSLAGRRPHLDMLSKALLMLALSNRVMPHSSPESASIGVTRLGSSSATPRARLTAAPVKKAEVFKEWRSLQADGDNILSCQRCRRQIENYWKCYVCSVCYTYLCNVCHIPIAAGSPPREYLEPIRQLFLHEKSMKSVLDALRGIAYHGSRVLRRVLDQNDMLKRWAHSQNKAYLSLGRDQGNSYNNRYLYAHFPKTNFVGWDAADILACSLSLDINTLD